MKKLLIILVTLALSLLLITGCELGITGDVNISNESNEEGPEEPEEPYEPEEPQEPELEFCGESTLYQCNADLDCKISGCNSEVCMGVDEEGFSTICEWLPCYAEKVNYNCKCHDSQCQWVAK